jgi:hypothetical protein
MILETLDSQVKLIRECGWRSTYNNERLNELTRMGKVRAGPAEDVHLCSFSRVLQMAPLPNFYDLIHTHRILPEESLDVDYTQQNEAYMQDRVAMLRPWPFFWMDSCTPPNWRFADRS